MSPTIYEKCPHLLANPERFEPEGEERVYDDRISNRRVFLGCHDCLKSKIEAEWAKTELGRKTLEHMRRVNLIEIKGTTIYAPKGLLKRVIEPKEMPNGEIIMMPGFRIDETYPVDPVLPPAEEKPEVVETAPEPEAPVPPELRAFIEPIVTANAKFVELWKAGKTGPLIGAAMREAKGKYEGKHIEAVLKEIVGG